MEKPLAVAVGRRLEMVEMSSHFCAVFTLEPVLQTVVDGHLALERRNVVDGQTVDGLIGLGSVGEDDVVAHHLRKSGRKVKVNFSFHT